MPSILVFLITICNLYDSKFVFGTKIMFFLLHLKNITCTEFRIVSIFKDIKKYSGIIHYVLFLRCTTYKNFAVLFFVRAPRVVLLFVQASHAVFLFIRRSEFCKLRKSCMSCAGRHKEDANCDFFVRNLKQC